MAGKIKFSFAEKTNGIIWKTLADPDNNRLFIENRNHETKCVTFSALDLDQKLWLWKGIEFEERWWITLQAVAGNTLLLTIYLDTGNPDQKSLLAYDICQQKMVWWRNHFALTTISGEKVIGIDTKSGSRQIGLNLHNGSEIAAETIVFSRQQNFMVIRPFQYYQNNAHFETLSTFVEKKCHISPINSIEYCEYNELILISTFENKNDLANYLFVFNSQGELILKETLGEHLTGMALDTFFIFSGYLIFVKNKSELVSYKIV